MDDWRNETRLVGVGFWGMNLRGEGLQERLLDVTLGGGGEGGGGERGYPALHAVQGAQLRKEEGRG